MNEVFGSPSFMSLTSDAALSEARRAARDLRAIYLETEAAEKRQRLAASVFYYGRESIMVTNENGEIEAINPAFTTMTGYAEDEVIGQTPRILKSNLHTLAFYEELWQTLMQQKRWQGEIWNRRKDGELFLVSTHIDVVSGDDGRILHFICGQTDITRLKVVEDHVEHLISHDPLTDLVNRSSLETMGNMLLAQASSGNIESAVMFLDLDRFKEINESLGHGIGDDVLVHVARRLQTLSRATDIVSRVGGDEFGIVFPGLGREYAMHMAVKILEALRKPFAIGEHHFSLSASIGVAMHPDDGGNIGELLKNADTALYRAKTDGRNTLVFYEPAMNETTYRQLMLEADLRDALANGHLVTYYQAKLDLHTGRPIGAEALLRWQHPERGLIPPGEFIPIAERSSLINEIGLWVLDDVCRQLAQWRDAGLPLYPVAVNLAASQFRSPELHEQIARLLNRYGLDASLLELELTETTLLKSQQQVMQNLSALRRMGLGLAIDDFGTGYSSLSYLKRLPITVLKIDQSFVRDLASSTEDQALVKSIISLGQSFRLKIVAEGVETEIQADFLRQHGCDFGQGYLFARPLPVADYVSWLLDRGQGSGAVLSCVSACA